MDNLNEQGVCSVTCLPSSNSAYALVHGYPNALPSMALHFLGRAAIVGAGLYVAGYRERKLWTGAVAGATGLEISLIAWALLEKMKKQHAV